MATFFLEESVRTLVETKLVGEPGAYRLVQVRRRPSRCRPQCTRYWRRALIACLPRRSTCSRRLRLSVRKCLALLQAIAELPKAAVHRSLTHLQAAEFPYETRLFPEHAYTFKHALTHEVAGGSLLQERRRGVHAHIVETLERLSPDRLTEQVEHLARLPLRGEVGQGPDLLPTGWEKC